MDSDALLRPRGPLPSGVYWRRRLVLLLVVAVSGWLVLKMAGGDARPAAKASPSPTPGKTASPAASPSASLTAKPSPSTSPSKSPSPGRSPGGPCRAADLTVEATTDARTYASGVRPVLTLAVTNTGPVACTRDLGQAARELRVRSGADRIWSSDDCSPGGSPAVATLRAGERRTFSVTWSRTRSASGCPSGQRQVAPGTYQVIGRLGDLTVTGASFTLR